MSIGSITLRAAYPPEMSMVGERGIKGIRDTLKSCEIDDFFGIDPAIRCRRNIPTLSLREADQYQHQANLKPNDAALAQNQDTKGLYHVFLGRNIYNRALKKLIVHLRALTKGHQQFKDLDFTATSSPNDPSDPNIFGTIVYDADIVAKAFNEAFKRNRDDADLNRLFELFKKNRILEFDRRGKVVVSDGADKDSKPKLIMFHEVAAFRGSEGTTFYALATHFMTRGRFEDSYQESLKYQVRGDFKPFAQYIQSHGLANGVCREDINSAECKVMASELGLLVASAIYADPEEATEPLLLMEYSTLFQSWSPEYNWSPLGLAITYYAPICRDVIAPSLHTELHTFVGKRWNENERYSVPNYRQTPTARDFGIRLHRDKEDSPTLNMAWGSISGNGVVAKRILTRFRVDHVGSAKEIHKTQDDVRVRGGRTFTVDKETAHPGYHIATGTLKRKLVLAEAFDKTVEFYCGRRAMLNPEYVNMVTSGFEILSGALIGGELSKMDGRFSDPSRKGFLLSTDQNYRPLKKYYADYRGDVLAGFRVWQTGYEINLDAMKKSLKYTKELFDSFVKAGKNKFRLRNFTEDNL